MTAGSSSTPAEKAAKVEKMVKYLVGTGKKVEAVVVNAKERGADGTKVETVRLGEKEGSQRGFFSLSLFHFFFGMVWFGWDSVMKDMDGVRRRRRKDIHHDGRIRSDSKFLFFFRVFLAWVGICFDLTPLTLTLSCFSLVTLFLPFVSGGGGDRR